MKRLLSLLLICLSAFAYAEEPLFDENSHTECNTNTWNRYKSLFGAEKIILCFPDKPIVSNANGLVTARANKGAITYAFSGYFPPMGQIDAKRWFEELLYQASQYPYKLVEHHDVSTQVMEYTYEDYVLGLTIRARAIVTPFNGYILQCVKPKKGSDHFNYFVDNCHIRQM